jgi:poly-gamma-glutamate synthesis protein (capsule biosynthesis protein)
MSGTDVRTWSARRVPRGLSTVVVLVALGLTGCAVVAIASVPEPRSAAGGPTSTVAIAGLPPQVAAAGPAPVAPPMQPVGATRAVGVDAEEVAGPASATERAVRLDPQPRWLTMAFVGDVLTHSPLWTQGERNAGAPGRYDFGPMWARVRHLIAGVDLAVCHLETPIAPSGEELSTYPVYGVPAEVITGIAGAGFDHCSTASNHTFDRGVAGLVHTVDVLEDHGLTQSGMARTPEEIRPQVRTVDGIAVALLSYTEHYNGLRPPAGEEWRSALIDPDRILADAAAALAAGAEVVVVSLHWGVEGSSTPTAEQRAIADRLARSGSIHLIVGHHAHVLQPIEKIGSTWVAYGLGNVLSNLPVSDRWPAASQDAGILQVMLSVDHRGRVRVERPVLYPTWVDKDAGWVIRPVLEDLADPGTGSGLRARLEASLARTQAVIAAALLPPS